MLTFPVVHEEPLWKRYIIVSVLGLQVSEFFQRLVSPVHIPSCAAIDFDGIKDAHSTE